MENSPSQYFVCTKCGKRFNWRSSLWNHKKVHSDEKEFRCSICSREFRWKASLVAHAKAHLERNEIADLQEIIDLWKVRSTRKRRNGNEEGETTYKYKVCNIMPRKNNEKKASPPKVLKYTLVRLIRGVGLENSPSGKQQEIEANMQNAVNSNFSASDKLVQTSACPVEPWKPADGYPLISAPVRNPGTVNLTGNNEVISMKSLPEASTQECLRNSLLACEILVQPIAISPHIGIPGSNQRNTPSAVDNDGGTNLTPSAEGNAEQTLDYGWFAAEYLLPPLSPLSDIWTPDHSYAEAPPNAGCNGIMSMISSHPSPKGNGNIGNSNQMADVPAPQEHTFPQEIMFNSTWNNGWL